MSPSAQLQSSNHSRGKIICSILALCNDPDEQRLTALDNGRLLRLITEAEVFSSAHRVSRHKAAGEDGLNSDLFKDTSELLVSALVIISNEVLNDANVPPSFLAALIIPQRKKVLRMTRWIIGHFCYIKPGTRCLLKCWQRGYKLHYLGLSATPNRALFTQNDQTSHMVMAHLSTALEQEELSAAQSLYSTAGLLKG